MAKRRGSHLERRFSEMIAGLVAGKLIPAPERELVFAPPRKWRFDFAWPAFMLAVEIEGGVHLGKAGRHTSAEGFTKDAEKYNHAAQLGWTVLRFTPKHLRNGYALAELNKVFLWR